MEIKNKSRKEIHRGDIFYVTDDPSRPSIGAEIWPNRAALVVSNDSINAHSDAIQIVYLSTSDKKRPSPTHIYVTSGKRRAIALCEQIHTVDISRICGKFGHASDSEMDDVSSALMFGLQINHGTSPQGIFKKWERYITTYNLENSIKEAVVH